MREFRLPTAEGRKSMTIAQLEQTLDEFNYWYMVNEEGMTISKAEKELRRIDDFEAYIYSRKLCDLCR